MENETRRVVEVRQSDHGGRRWSAARTVLTIADEPQRWGLPEALAGRDGRIHLFFLRRRDGDPHGTETGEDDKPAARAAGASRCIDIWHCRSGIDTLDFEPPRCVWRGYTGALNSVVQLRDGRILLPFSYSIPARWNNRGRTLADFSYRGYYRSTVLFSDDQGAIWNTAPQSLPVPVPDISYAYGAVEPVAVELGDGRVWMVIRTQMGRFYEAFSRDGLHWSDPRPTRLLSSDSPAGLVRLADGRIVLLWNNCLRFPYAYGGRHVLHAAISADDGATWRGFREVYRDPRNAEPPPVRGDHGTAYPFPVATAGDRVLFASGQGAGRRALSVLDPAWLEVDRQTDDFDAALEGWSVFGTAGVAVVEHPGGRPARAVRVSNPDGRPAAAVRNFPLLRRGRLELTLRPASGWSGARIVVTDHFSVPFDGEDDLHAVFVAEVSADTGSGDAPLPVMLDWDCDARRASLQVAGGPAAAAVQLRESPGPSYLRLRCRGEQPDAAGFLIERCHVYGA